MGRHSAPDEDEPGSAGTGAGPSTALGTARLMSSRLRRAVVRRAAQAPALSSLRRARHAAAEDDANARLSDTKPGEEAPVEEASAHEAPLEDAPVDEASVEEAPLEDVPVDEAPVVEASVQDAPVEEAPFQDAPVEEAPFQDAPVEEAPFQDAPVEEAPVEDAPVEETFVEDAPVEDAPAEEASVEEAPVDEAPVEEAPAPAEQTQPAQTAANAPRTRGTHGDLRMLRENPALRARCAAAVVVPFALFTVILLVIGRADVYLLWLWIPTVSAGVLVGLFLDRAARSAPRDPTSG